MDCASIYIQQHRLDKDEESKAENGVQKRVQHIYYTRVCNVASTCEAMAHLASANVYYY